MLNDDQLDDLIGDYIDSLEQGEETDLSHYLKLAGDREAEFSNAVNVYLQKFSAFVDKGSRETKVSITASGNELSGKEDATEYPPLPMGYVWCDKNSILGSGAMGTVYKVKQTSLNRIVAIKIIKGNDPSEEQIDRLREEGKKMAKLNHENIVKVYDALFENNLHYIIFEFIDGLTLEELLKLDHGMISNLSLINRLEVDPYQERKIQLFERNIMSTLAHIFLKLSEGLLYSHDMGIIHRDIKPSNIMFEKHTCRPVILDFGVSSYFGIKSNDQRRYGTLPYMPPEATMANEKENVTWDIYALGITFFQAITGQLPFPTDSIESMHLGKQSGKFKKLHEILPLAPQAISGMIEKCIQPKYSNRYPHLHLLIGDLKSYLVDENYRVYIPSYNLRKFFIIMLLMSILLFSKQAFEYFSDKSKHKEIMAIITPKSELLVEINSNRNENLAKLHQVNNSAALYLRDIENFHANILVPKIVELKKLYTKISLLMDNKEFDGALKLVSELNLHHQILEKLYRDFLEEAERFTSLMYSLESKETEHIRKVLYEFKKEGSCFLVTINHLSEIISGNIIQDRSVNP